MQFLNTFAHDFASRSHRWVFSRKPSERAQVEGDGDIDRKLSSPRTFGVADIRKLEGHLREGGELSAEQKSRLNSVLEFNLSLVGQNYDANLPSRLMFELRYSGLWKFMRPYSQRRVEALISHEREKLGELAEKDIASFSDGQMSRFLRLYQSYQIKARRTKLTEKDKIFEKLATKFVSHAQSLMGGFKIQNNKLVPSDPNADRAYLKILRTRDKLFILQSYRMFPNHGDWADSNGQPVSEKLKEYSQCILRELKEELEAEGSDDVEERKSIQKRIELLPYWEIVEDLLENESVTFAEEVRDLRTTGMQRYAEQARTANFLDWVNGWKKAGNSQFLPEHIKALKEIEDNHLDSYGEDGVFGASTEDLEAVIKQFEKDNGTLYVPQKDDNGKDQLVSVTKVIEDLRDSIGNKEKYEAFKKTRDKLLNSTTFKEAVRTGIQGDGRQLLDRAFVNYQARFTQDFDIEAFDAAERKPVWEIEVKATLDHLYEWLQTEKDSGDFNDSANFKELFKSVDSFFLQPWGSEFKQKTANVQAEIEKHQKTVAKNDARLARYLSLSESFSQSSEQAETAIKDFSKSFLERLETRRLTASDMAVLFDADTQDVITYTEDAPANLAAFAGQLQDFRENFRPVVDEIIGYVSDNVGNLTVSGEDKNRLWFKILDEALGQQFIRSQIADLDGNAFQDILGNRNGNEIGIDGTELISAVVASYRKEIYEGIIGRVRFKETVTDIMGNTTEVDSDFTEKALSEFLSKYDRLHSHVYDVETKNKVQKNGIQAYLDRRKQDRIMADKANTEIAQKLGSVGREEFLQSLVSYLKPGVDRDGIMARLEADTGLYKAILKMNGGVTGEVLDIHGVSSNPFFTQLKNYIPAELHDRAFEDLFEKYILWQAGKQQKNIINSAGDVLIEGEDGTPGRRMINEMRLRSVNFEGDCKVLQSEFNHDIDFQIRRLGSAETIEHSEISVLLARSVNEYLPRLQSIKNNLKAVLLDEFPEYETPFIASYIATIERALDLFSRHIEAVDEAYKGHSWDKNSVSDLERLKAAFLGIYSAFSIENGTMADLDSQLVKSFEKIPETVQYLKDELGLFEPGGKNKAEDKFKKMRSKYKPVFETYKDRNEKVIERLKWDLAKLKPNDFKERHGIPKGAAQTLIDEIEEAVKIHSEGWEKYADPNYFSDWFDRYQNPAEQTSALLDFQAWPELEKQTKDVIKVNDQNGKWIKAYEKNRLDRRLGTLPTRFIKNTFGSIRHGQLPWGYRIKYSFSLMDLFYRMPKKLFEAFDRREERRRERAVAELGKTIFGASNMGKEFNRMAWEEEEKRVKEFETLYERENFNYWEEQLYKIKHPGQKDEARALINLLIKDGYMRWDKPALWVALENLQGRPAKVKFQPSDLRTKSLDDIMEMIGEACGTIWTTKIFTDWDGQLEGNHKKQMESNYKNFDRTCNVAGALDSYFSDAIERWKNNDKSVNPAEYEGFLHRAFEYAKYNGAPDKRWFYIVMGMTVKNDRGESLLSHEAMARFNKTHLKVLPYFDFFVDNICEKKNGRPVPDGTPGAHSGAWNHEDVQEWGDFLRKEMGDDFTDTARVGAASEKFFYNYVMNSPTAKLRADRFARMGGKEQDHDDAWMHGSGGSYENLLQLLNRSSQGMDTISPDFAAQLPQAYDKYMRHTSDYLREMEALVGGTPDWQKWKNEKLIEAGLMMRKMFMVVNTIAGNFHGSDRTAPLVVDAKYWLVDGNKTNLRENREKINDGMRELLELNDYEVENDQIFDFVGSRIGSNIEDRKGVPEYDSISQEVGNILNNLTLYSDPSTVESMMKKLYPPGS